jgi:hypothetical protein
MTTDGIDLDEIRGIVATRWLLAACRNTPVRQRRPWFRWRRPGSAREEPGEVNSSHFNVYRLIGLVARPG